VKRTETLDLLGIISSFVPNFDDKNEKRIRDWNKALGNMSYDEAAKHMYEHFRESRFIPMPVDILARAKADFNPDNIIPLEPPDDMRGGAQHV